MIDTNSFTKMVPGFDFLQQMMKGAGQSVPPMGQWVAPTLDPKEIEKRIGELKTVQFWLEQNARMLGATVQALEVQRMTLSTLQSMNLPMSDLQQALAAPAGKADKAAADAAPPMVDPMAWWNALTQQFGELASQAVHDGGADIASRLASAQAAAPAKAAAKSSKRAPAKSSRRR